MSSRLLLLALLVDGLCAFAAPMLFSHVLPGSAGQYVRIAGACVEMRLDEDALEGGRIVDDGLCRADGTAS